VPPEIREEDPLPGVPAPAPGPGIHHDPTARRGADGHRVPLTHVQHHQLQRPPSQDRLPGGNEKECGGPARHGQPPPHPRPQPGGRHPPKDQEDQRTSGGGRGHPPRRGPEGCQGEGCAPLHTQTDPPEEELHPPRREGPGAWRPDGEEKGEEDPRDGHRHHRTQEERGRDPHQRHPLEVPRHQGKGPQGGRHTRRHPVPGPGGHPLPPVPEDPFLQGAPEPHDAGGSGEGELKAHPSYRSRLQNQEEEEATPQGSPSVDGPAPDPGQRQGGDQGGGPGGGVGSADGEYVSPRSYRRPDGRSLPGPAGPPEHGEEDPGHHPHVEPGDGHEVGGTGEGEGLPEARIHPLPPGQDQRLGHRGLLPEEGVDPILNPAPRPEDGGGGDPILREGVPSRRHPGPGQIGTPGWGIGVPAPAPSHHHGFPRPWGGHTLPEDHTERSPAPLREPSGHLEGDRAAAGASVEAPRHLAAPPVRNPQSAVGGVPKLPPPAGDGPRKDDGQEPGGEAGAAP